MRYGLTLKSNLTEEAGLNKLLKSGNEQTTILIILFKRLDVYLPMQINCQP